MFQHKFINYLNIKNVLQENGSKESCETYHIDHHHPSSKNKSNIAILYGELGTPEFAIFHQVLKRYAQEGFIDYVLRHFVKVIYFNYNLM